MYWSFTFQDWVFIELFEFRRVWNYFLNTFEKIHRSFTNNLKSEETKSQIKAHLSYHANSYFYNYKPSPRILRQHRVLRNLGKNKYIIITKLDKENGVVILGWKLYDNVIEDKIHPNIKFTIEKQINNSIAFLDVFISGINNQNLTLQTYHKLTYTGLLLNFQSFISFSYKISLIKDLLDRSFKICNNWNSFHNDIESIKSTLVKNAYPSFLIDKFIKKYLNYKFSSNQNQLKDTSDVHYLYIGNLSHHIKNRLSKLCTEFWKENININLVFTSFKIKIYFHIKTQFLMI